MDDQEQQTAADQRRADAERRQIEDLRGQVRQQADRQARDNAAAEALRTLDGDDATDASTQTPFGPTGRTSSQFGWPGPVIVEPAPEPEQPA